MPEKESVSGRKIPPKKDFGNCPVCGAEDN